MNSAEVAARIEHVFARVFGDRVTFDPQLARVDETYWTSLKHMEFLIALESEFGLRFDGADATDMTSIPIVVERIEARLA
jgi:acyl carrier protein